MFPSRSKLRELALAQVAWLLCACTPNPEPKHEHEHEHEICEAKLPTPLETPEIWSLRRLSRTELARTFEALIGIIPESVRQLPSEQNDPRAIAPAPSSFEVEVYQGLAEQAAAPGATALLTKWACGRDAVCLRESVARWIERAQRAPLSPEERDAYLAILPVDADPEPALRNLLELIFQSPRFLYVIEHGVAFDPNEQSRVLTPWELASRLSYYLWSEPPDDALRIAAESGALSDPSVMRAQARRMLIDPRAARMLGAALQKWAAPELDIVAKAQSVYPEFDPELRSAMVEQFTRFAAMAIADGSSLADLFTTARAPIDARLAPLLGVKTDKGGTWKIAELAPPRFGLLTLPGVLTSNARSDDSSPVQRGLFIRQNVLCQPVAPPPPGVAALPPAGTSGTSFRERFAAHTDSAVCATCHQLMDPLGFPFEIYDGLGRLRSRPESIQTAGKLDGVSKPVEFANLQGLVDALLAAPEVSRCWARQWLQRALGPDAAREGELLDTLTAKVAQGAPFTDLLVEIVLAPGFSRVHRPQAD